MKTFLNLIVGLLVVGFIAQLCSDDTDTGTSSSFSSSNSEEQSSSESKKSGSLYEHLSSNEFSLNGNGHVHFSFAFGSDTKGRLSVRGGTERVEGDFKIRGNSVYVSDLVAVAGNYDPNRNSGASGVLYLKSDGSLSGRLDGRKFTFYPK